MDKNIDNLIYVSRRHIRDLSQQQDKIFETLTKHLQLNREGEQWMFDYIYNSEEEEKYITFEEYLSFYNKFLKDLVE